MPTAFAAGTEAEKYRALFELVDEYEEIAAGLYSGSFDLHETRAGYCRCVYETTDSRQRVEFFLYAMNVDAVMAFGCSDGVGLNATNLRDRSCLCGWGRADPARPLGLDAQ